MNSVDPRLIPREVARSVGEEIELDIGGVIGGIPGGVPGGRLAGVVGRVIGGIPDPRAQPPPLPPEPVRVGGNIRRRHLLRRVQPLYPLIARQGRSEGVVRIDAIINVSGREVEMEVLSGHPLLVKSTLDAVQRWVYEPT